MKGDFTRSTFDPEKHYSGVRMQQGRVQLDADWNEQVDIQTYLLEQRTRDVVGRCGAPIHKAGFALTVEDGKLMIGTGHYYVHGILCENETKCEFTKQDDLPGAKLPYTTGNYLFYFYLDVWQRHITAVEDDSIREKALGGPDTATRTKTVWQVKWLTLKETLDENPCVPHFPEWDILTSARYARLKADALPEESSEKPCIVPPGAGYRGLENHLYRVEIHKSGTIGTATFKWSRDNGSILRAIENIEEETITIINPGQDVLHAFAPEQWVEITDDKRELNEQPGTLVRLTGVTDGVKLRFDPNTALGDQINSTKFPKERNPRVRRWDQTESAEIEISDQWIELEHGLEVKFKSGDTYRSGDYWMIPARAATGKIEWSNENEGWQQRFGIEHHYCPLAILSYSTRSTRTRWELIRDCRRFFSPIAEMVTLSYVGGDGQEAMPGRELPAPLEVRVAVGEHPIEDAQVKFTIIYGNGTLQPSNGSDGNLQPSNGSDGKELVVKTGSDGLAMCRLQLDKDSPPVLRVEATLLDVVLLNDKGEPITEDQEFVHPSVHFNANLSTAAEVAYEPSTECSELQNVNTVKGALDKLCQMRRGGGCLVTVGEGGRFEDLDEAIQNLNSPGEDICICLLPGEHELQNGLNLDGTQASILQIVGCGRGTKIKVKGQLKFTRFDSLTLRDIELIFGDSVNEPIVLENCGEIRMDSCLLAGKVENDGALLTIGASNHRIWMGKNVIKAFRNADSAECQSIAIDIMCGDADLTMEDNEVIGLVRLYGTKPEVYLVKENLEMLKTHIDQLKLIGRGVLRLRGNRLDRMVVSGDVVERLANWLENQGATININDLFQTIFLTDNIIANGLNQWMACDVRMTSGRFDMKGDLGWVIAKTAIYMGNSTQSALAELFDFTTSSKEAANLNISII
jgi:hypothetical protein